MLDTQLTTAEVAVAGGIIGAMVGTIFVFALIFYILMVIANWRIFEKAGEKGWKSLIPIYNVYIMFKIVKMKTWFWYLIMINVIAAIMYMIEGFNPYATTEIGTTTLSFAIYPMSTIALIFVTVVELIATIIYSYRTAKVFGKSTGFAVGLFFLPWIFWFILAFGKAKYNRKAIKA